MLNGGQLPFGLLCQSFKVDLQSPGKVFLPIQESLLSVLNCSQLLRTCKGITGKESAAPATIIVP